jgi:hypothetical protein
VYLKEEETYIERNEFFHSHKSRGFIKKWNRHDPIATEEQSICKCKLGSLNLHFKADAATSVKTDVEY